MARLLVPIAKAESRTLPKTVTFFDYFATALFMIESPYVSLSCRRNTYAEEVLSLWPMVWSPLRRGFEGQVQKTKASIHFRARADKLGIWWGREKDNADACG